jgi:hypothetical protein
MMERDMDEKRTLEMNGEAEFKNSRLRKWNKEGINQRYYHQTTKRESPMSKKREEKKKGKQTTR